MKGEEDTTTTTDGIDSCILQGKAQEERKEKGEGRERGRLVQETDDQDHDLPTISITSNYVERNLQRQTTFNYV